MKEIVKIVFVLVFVSIISVYGFAKVSAECSKPNTTYFTNGLQSISPISDYGEDGKDMITLSDGSMLFGGDLYSESDSSLFVKKVLSNGNADTEFAKGGLFIYSELDTDVTFTLIRSTPAGKILIAGRRGPDMLVIQLTSSGELDESFNTTGVLIIPEYSESGNPDQVWRPNPFDIIIEPSNFYIISNHSACWGFYYICNDKGYINQYSYTGTELSTNWIPKLETGMNFIIRGVVKNSSGTYVLYNYGEPYHFTPPITYNLTIVKLSGEDTVDTSYGSGGYVYLTTSDYSAGKGIVTDPSANLYILANTSNDGGNKLWKVNSAGQLDNTFGTNGMFTYDLGNLQNLIYSSNGLYATGYNKPTEVEGDFVWKFALNGTLDKCFNSNGILKQSSSITDTYYAVKSYLNGTTLKVLLIKYDGEIERIAVLNLTEQYQICSVQSSMNVYNSSDKSIVGGTTTGVSGSNTITAKYSGKRLVRFTKNVVGDQNWSSVSGGLDTTNKKAYLHGLSSGFTLYIPRRSYDNAVIICPNANSLAEISPTCSGGYYLYDQTIRSYEGISYWKVDNLTGTGGMSVWVNRSTGETQATADTNGDEIEITPTTTPTVTVSIVPSITEIVPTNYETENNLDIKQPLTSVAPLSEKIKASLPFILLLGILGGGVFYIVKSRRNS